MLHRRNAFLINKKFQLRFSFYVCSWLVALSCAYPLIISNIFDYFIHYLSLDPMGPSLAHLEKTRHELLWLLILMQLVLLSLTFLISIFMSHRIVGPLFKLRTMFQEARTGKYDQKLVFRKQDYFQELSSEYNSMMEQIRSKMDQQALGIQIAISKIDKLLQNGLHSEAPKELESALAALREAQKD